MCVCANMMMMLAVNDDHIIKCQLTGLNRVPLKLGDAGKKQRRFINWLLFFGTCHSHTLIMGKLSLLMD